MELFCASNTFLLPGATVLTLLEKKNKDRKLIIYIAYDTGTYTSYIKIYTHASKSLVNKIGVAFILPEFHLKVGKGSVMNYQFTLEKCLQYC